METLQFAFRSLRQAPGFALVAILALALGIGANSAIFSVVNAIFLRPLPYADADAIVQLTSSVPEQQLDGIGFSWPRLQAVRERQQSFSVIAMSIGSGFNVTGDGDPEQVQGMQVSHEFFPLLGVQPALGRIFVADEDRPGGEPVAIVSHGFWQRRFGGQADAIGKPVMLNGLPHTIIGVMAPTLSSFPMNNVDVWTPRPLEVGFLVREQIDGGGFFFNVWGRLKPGVTLAQAREELAVIAAAYNQANPTNVDAKSSAELNPLLDDLVGDQAQTYALLFAAVGCVLLIACANVANLVLARYASRRKQVAIRFALGAKRRHVIAQFIAENLVLALAGGLLGLALAAAALRLLVGVGEDFIPRAESIGLEPAVIVFTLLVSLATGLLLGLFPALQLRRETLNDTLKDSSRDSAGGRRQNRVRSGLMIAEIAVSFVLLIAASLLINSFVRLQKVSPGFDPDGVFVGLIQVPGTQYPDRSEALVSFYSRLWQGLATIPGATSVALNDTPPLSGFAGQSPYAAVGEAIPPLSEQPTALRHLISPNAFGVIGVPIVKGRDFNERDTPTSPPVVIINEAMAKQLFGDADPLGRQIKSGMLQLQQEIVGVVADMHSANLATPPVPEMYYPILQRPEGFTTMMVRTDGDPALLAASVRAVLKTVDAGIPMINPTTLRAFVDQSTADRRLTMWLLAAFAGLALILASLGVYSVMAYSVGQRSGEIGVRMAMGAHPRDVQQLVVRQGMALTAIGLAIGVTCALLLTRMMNALLFGVGASDPLTYLSIIVALGLVALAACWFPARRAARVDPLVALRGE